VTARAAMPTDLPRVAKFLSDAAAVPEAIVGSVLPRALAAGAFSGWLKLLPGTFGMRTRVRVYLEEYRGRICSVSLVYAGRRPEWVVLALAALPDPSGSEGSFRLLSHIAGAAAQRGMLRVFGAVSDEARPRETFFQAGFYSYTRETWYAAPRGPLTAPKISAGVSGSASSTASSRSPEPRPCSAEISHPGTPRGGPTPTISSAFTWRPRRMPSSGPSS